MWVGLQWMIVIFPDHTRLLFSYMSQCMRFSTMWYVRPAMAQPAHTRSLMRVFAGRLNILGLLSY